MSCPGERAPHMAHNKVMERRREPKKEGESATTCSGVRPASEWRTSGTKTSAPGPCSPSVATLANPPMVSRLGCTGRRRHEASIGTTTAKTCQKPTNLASKELGGSRGPVSSKWKATSGKAGESASSSTLTSPVVSQRAGCSALATVTESDVSAPCGPGLLRARQFSSEYGICSEEVVCKGVFVV